MPDLRTGEPVSPDVREKVLAVHERLCAKYECPIAYFHHLDPLSELVSSLLSHRTRNADSGRAFKALRSRYVDWSGVRDAPVADVQALIECCTWPEQKAPRIQQVLREVTARRGELSLDFLGTMSVADARAWLEELPGVGPKTSAAVLSFSTLRKRALPVDSHHHRVAVRLALIGPKVGVAAAHDILAAQLPAEWDAQQVYDNHEVMMLHGQRCCFYENPACDRCVVLGLCPHGQARLADAARWPHEERPGQRAPGRETNDPAAAAPVGRRSPDAASPPIRPPG